MGVCLSHQKTMMRVALIYDTTHLLQLGGCVQKSIPLTGCLSSFDEISFHKESSLFSNNITDSLAGVTPPPASFPIDQPARW